MLFLDTSALVKLYVIEHGSEVVRRWVDDDEHVACQWLAYVEARSAFAAKHRAGELSEGETAACREAFEGDWRRYHRTVVTESLIRRAGALCEPLGLGAYDSFHLASAEYLQAALGSAVVFGSFDSRQCDAARELGLRLAPSDGFDSGGRSPDKP